MHCAMLALACDVLVPASMKTTHTRKLSLQTMTIQPLQLAQVTGGGITEATTVTTATTSITVFQTKWCKPTAR